MIFPTLRGLPGRMSLLLALALCAAGAVCGGLAAQAQPAAKPAASKPAASKPAVPKPAVPNSQPAAPASDAARAQRIVVGVDISATGPASVLGLQSKNAVRLWPRTLGGVPADYIVTDDASDAGRAVANGRKLVDTDNVDALVASNITPIALDVLPIAAQSRTPLISLAASSTIVQPMDAERRWVFKMPQNDSLMAAAIVDDMVRRGYGRVAFIAYADAYGDSWWHAFSQAAAGRLELVAQERYMRTDKNLAGQALRIIAARPDAVLVAASGTGAALPQLALHERGFTGQMYQTHGVGTSAFLSVGGTAVEGTRFPTGPALLARQLPASNPVRQAAMAFTDKYEAQYGPNTVTQFSADAYGAWILLDAAAARALQTGARPGTPEFRAALRSALEGTRELSVPNGVMNMSQTEHQGFDSRARVMGVVKGGKFTYAGE